MLTAPEVVLNAEASPETEIEGFSYNPVADGQPEQLQLFGKEPINVTGTREFLRLHAWPIGLQDALLKGLNKIPIRFIICDDSGSMTTPDGMKFEVVNGKHT